MRPTSTQLVPCARWCPPARLLSRGQLGSPGPFSGPSDSPSQELPGRLPPDGRARRSVVALRCRLDAAVHIRVRQLVVVLDF